MGKQINFYMDEELEKNFLEHILNHGGEILFQNGRNIKPIVVREYPSSKEKYWFNLYLYKKEFGKLVYEDINNHTYINSLQSPVIEFNRTVVREIGRNKEIGSGRLYLEMNYWNSEEELVQKPIKIGGWYKSLAAWIKKHAQRDKEIGYYVSPTMKKMINEGFRPM